jgi:guanylate kinase
LILYNSRPPRPGEHDGIDYRFRRRYELEMMQLDKDCICMDVREDFQVLNVRELVHLLERGPVLFEGNPFIARILQTDQRLLDVEHRSIFLSPFSKEELIEIDATEDAPPVKDVVAEIMRQKLVRRTQRQKGQLEESDLESIYLRSKSTWQELTMAPLFDHVVVNHDGEDSDNWTNAPVLTGEARLATEAVFAGFCGIPDRRLEHWAGGVLSRQGTQLAEHV